MEFSLESYGLGDDRVLRYLNGAIIKETPVQNYFTLLEKLKKDRELEKDKDEEEYNDDTDVLDENDVQEQNLEVYEEDQEEDETKEGEEGQGENSEQHEGEVVEKSLTKIRNRKKDANANRSANRSRSVRGTRNPSKVYKRRKRKPRSQMDFLEHILEEDEKKYKNYKDDEEEDEFEEFLEEEEGGEYNDYSEVTELFIDDRKVPRVKVDEEFLSELHKLNWCNWNLTASTICMASTLSNQKELPLEWDESKLDQLSGYNTLAKIKGIFDNLNLSKNLQLSHTVNKQESKTLKYSIFNRNEKLDQMSQKSLNLSKRILTSLTLQTKFLKMIKEIKKEFKVHISHRNPVDLTSLDVDYPTSFSINVVFYDVSYNPANLNLVDYRNYNQMKDDPVEEFDMEPYDSQKENVWDLWELHNGASPYTPQQCLVSYYEPEPTGGSTDGSGNTNSNNTTNNSSSTGTTGNATKDNNTDTNTVSYNSSNSSVSSTNASREGSFSNSGSKSDGDNNTSNTNNTNSNNSNTSNTNNNNTTNNTNSNDNSSNKDKDSNMTNNNTSNSSNNEEELNTRLTFPQQVSHFVEDNYTLTVNSANVPLYRSDDPHRLLYHLKRARACLMDRFIFCVLSQYCYCNVKAGRNFLHIGDSTVFIKNLSSDTVYLVCEGEDVNVSYKPGDSTETGETIWKLLVAKLRDLLVQNWKRQKYMLSNQTHNLLGEFLKYSVKLIKFRKGHLDK